MSDQFAHLNNYDPKGRKAWCPLPIEGGAQLQLLHAGQCNTAYSNALSKTNAANGSMRGMTGAEMLAMNIELERELFPKYVVVGWKGIIDGRGKPVKYSANACSAFFAALPDWIVQRVSQFAARPENFSAKGSPTDAQVDRQAGE